MKNINGVAYVFTAWTIIMIACSPVSQKKEGEQLVAQYCSSCHLPVLANMLDRKSWVDFVLPAMAPKLGIKVFGLHEYVNDPYDTSELISFNNWTKLVAYYITFAPEKLEPASAGRKLIRDWSIFTLRTPAPMSSDANTILVAIDSAGKKIYSGNSSHNEVLRWNDSLKIEHTTILPSPTAKALFGVDTDSLRNILYTSIGTILARDLWAGTVLKYRLDDQMQKRPDTIATGLNRPIQTISADLNKDGLTDYVVACFGHNSGGLYWFEQLPGNKFIRKPIIEIPGATNLFVDDYNHDGWPDIMVLFAHAQESIRLFLNDHKGFSTSRILLQFTPVAGSSSFQLADFNKDGLPDILYTNGDNGDLSRILKPFHGVHIYINKGNFNYEEVWFYPVNGCTKAVADDFDLDGDLDIASIAFYADHLNNPAEKFIYFEQQSYLNFEPHSPPIESYGRWLCMDVNDYDGDGDHDIVLGNFAERYYNERNFKINWRNDLPFIVLENKTR